MQSFKIIFSSVTILQGVEFPIFLLIFALALQQYSATALPVIYLLPAVGTVTVHAIAVVDSVLQLFVAERCVVVTDRNGVVLRYCTRRYIGSVRARKKHSPVVLVSVLTKRFQRQVARCAGWRYLVCSGVIRGHRTVLYSINVVVVVVIIIILLKQATCNKCVKPECNISPKRL